MPHAALIKVEHAARPERSDVIDLDDQLLIAALHQRESRLIEPAIANTTKAIAQFRFDRRSPCSGVVEFAGGRLWAAFLFPAAKRIVVEAAPMTVARASVASS